MNLAAGSIYEIANYIFLSWQQLKFGEDSSQRLGDYCMETGVPKTLGMTNNVKLFKFFRSQTLALLKFFKSRHGLAGSGLRFPAPHLRSSPSLFASFYNQPASGEPSLEPLPSLSASQTVDKHCPVQKQDQTVGFIKYIDIRPKFLIYHSQAQIMALFYLASVFAHLLQRFLVGRV